MTNESEAVARQIFIAEAKTWLGTPFRDQGDVKGPNGAVDCAMLLVRCAVDTGLVERFDPRPYPPQWHLHRNDERFLEIVRRFGREVAREPLPGDVIVWRVARCFAHGGIVIETPRSSSPARVARNESEAVAHKGTHVIHAYYKTGHVTISALNEVELACLPDGKPRPFKLFDMWAAG